MGEMIERIAKALALKHYSERFSNNPAQARLNADANWTMYLDYAETAVRAMYEPTELQKHIARDYFGMNPFQPNGAPMDQLWLSAWQAMVRAEATTRRPDPLSPAPYPDRP